MMFETDLPPRHRRIFCNRTLNLRQVQAIGYDMDYTLIHYHIETWERRAYDYAKAKLQQQGLMVQALQFNPELMVRGLILDTQLGNILKVNNFGHVKQAFHGSLALGFDKQRQIYGSLVISLHDTRYVFLNTLFSLSEACLYAQLVDLLDQQKIPGILGYADVYRHVRDSIDQAHVEGALKAEIIMQPERYVQRDEATALALLDQKQAGKKLLLITNSDWHYTRAMMTYVFDEYLPKGQTWRSLFDYVIVGARKPDFFTSRAPLFDIVNEEGLLQPNTVGMSEGKAYWGGDAQWVERTLSLSGDQILYVGDHIYGDVNVSKTLLRWRTALILRELEQELANLEAFEPQKQRLEQLMQQKEHLELQISQELLSLQRSKLQYITALPQAVAKSSVRANLAQLRKELFRLDEEIKPLVESASRLNNAHWGPIMRAGNDKSHLARQIERYADIYMSRVSNFLFVTPFAYLRAIRGSLPHDPNISLATV